MPDYMLVLKCFAYAFIGSLAFRGRGGVFNELASFVKFNSKIFSFQLKLNTEDGRLIYAAIMSALIAHTWAQFGAFTVAFFIGAFPGYLTDTDRMATTAKGLELQTERGIIFVAPLLVAMDYFGLPGASMLLAGAMLGVCAKFAGLWSPNIHDLRQWEFCEALYGAALGIGAALVT